MTAAKEKGFMTIRYIVLFFVAAVLCFNLFSIIKVNIDIPWSGQGIAWGMISCVLLFAFVCLISLPKKKEYINIILIILLSFLCLLVWNYFVKAQPVSDYKVLWEGARQITEGSFYDRAVKKDDYFCFYNFQIGYTFYLSLLYRLFGGSLAAVRIWEICVIVSTNVVFYKTIRLFTGARTSFGGTCLFVFYPFIFMGSGILNNQHEAMLLEGLAVFLFLRYAGKQIKPFIWILAGLFLSTAVLMRPTAIVIVAGIIFISFLRAVTMRSKQYLIAAVVILVSYLVISNVTNVIFTVTDIAPYGLKNSNMWFKLSLGLTGEGITHQPSTDAQHTNLYYDLQYYNFDYDAYKKAAAKYIAGLFSSRKIDLGYIWDKITGYCGAADNQYYFTGTDFLKDHPVLTDTLCIMGICLYFVSISFSIVRLRISNILSNNEVFLPGIVFVSFFIVYIVLETQTRYRYEQYYMLFLLAVPALGIVYNSLRKKILQKRSR